MTAFIKNGTETVCPAHRLSRKKPPYVPCTPPFLTRYRLSRTVCPVLTVYPAGISGGFNPRCLHWCLLQAYCVCAYVHISDVSVCTITEGSLSSSSLKLANHITDKVYELSFKQSLLCRSYYC